MSQEAVVTAADVLHAIQELKRRGAKEMLHELEDIEPDLIEHLLEEVTAIHHELYHSHQLSHRRHQRTTRRIQSLAIVIALASRNGYRRLLADSPRA